MTANKALHKYLAASVLVLATAPAAFGHTPDDPLLTKVLLDVHWAPSETQNLDWNARAWVGKDLHKLWLKTEGEVDDGHTEHAQTQLLYGNAVSPYWDAVIGWRHDFQPGEARDWLAVGAQGLAPYFFETEVTFFVGDGGDTALSFETERELMITQKWALSPHIEADFYGQNDPARGLGSGLATVEAGVHLSYEVRREIVPYVGVSWSKAFGNTAEYQADAGHGAAESHAVVGLEAWF